MSIKNKHRLVVKHVLIYRTPTNQVYDGHTCKVGRLGRFRNPENNAHWLVPSKYFQKKGGGGAHI